MKVSLPQLRLPFDHKIVCCQPWQMIRLDVAGMMLPVLDITAVASYYGMKFPCVATAQVVVLRFGESGA